MNCFNHPDRPAIGICKACNKGLCNECATDLIHGIACKNRHETDVQNLNMIISRNVKIYSSAPKNTMLAPIFYLFIGIVFAGFGFFSKGGTTDLPFILGVLFIVFGIIFFIKNRDIFSNKSK